MSELTPKQISDHSAKVFTQIDEALKAHNNPVSAQLSAAMQCMQALWEIAAQLGELNEWHRAKKGEAMNSRPAEQKRCQHIRQNGSKCLEIEPDHFGPFGAHHEFVPDEQKAAITEPGFSFNLRVLVNLSTGDYEVWEDDKMLAAFRAKADAEIWIVSRRPAAPTVEPRKPSPATGGHNGNHTYSTDCYQCGLGKGRREFAAEMIEWCEDKLEEIGTYGRKSEHSTGEFAYKAVIARLKPEAER
jgi:hypothetical protein